MPGETRRRVKRQTGAWYRRCVRTRDLFLLPATVVVACGGTLWGGHHSYVALQNRAPLEITCADYLQSRPDAGWLRLTHCFPDFDHVGIETFTRKTAKDQSGTTTTAGVYVPLRAAQHSTDARTKILLLSDDDDMLTLGGFSPTLDERVVIELSTSVEGLVESGLALSQRRRTEIANLHLRLTDDFVILERGARPRPLWFALGELWLGIAAVTLLVRRYRRWSRGGPVVLPRATLRRERAPSDADEAS